MGDDCGCAQRAQQQQADPRSNKRRCRRLHVGGVVLQRACGGGPGCGGAGGLGGFLLLGGRCSGEAAARGPRAPSFNVRGVRPTATHGRIFAPPAKLRTLRRRSRRHLASGFVHACSPCIDALICSNKHVLRDADFGSSTPERLMFMHQCCCMLLKQAAKRNFGAPLLACRPPPRMPPILATCPPAMAAFLGLSLFFCISAFTPVRRSAQVAFRARQRPHVHLRRPSDAPGAAAPSCEDLSSGYIRLQNSAGAGSAAGPFHILSLAGDTSASGLGVHRVYFAQRRHQFYTVVCRLTNHSPGNCRGSLVRRMRTSETSACPGVLMLLAFRVSPCTDRWLRQPGSMHR